MIDVQTQLTWSTDVHWRLKRLIGAEAHWTHGWRGISCGGRCRRCGDHWFGFSELRETWGTRTISFSDGERPELRTGLAFKIMHYLVGRFLMLDWSWLYDEYDAWRVTFWEICGDLRSSWCRGNGPSALALAAALSGLVPEVRHMGSQWFPCGLTGPNCCRIPSWQGWLFRRHYCTWHL